MPLVRFIGGVTPQDNTEILRLEPAESGEERLIHRGRDRDPVEVSGDELRQLASNYEIEVVEGESASSPLGGQSSSSSDSSSESSTGSQTSTSEPVDGGDDGEQQTSTSEPVGGGSSRDKASTTSAGASPLQSGGSSSGGGQ